MMSAKPIGPSGICVGVKGGNGPKKHVCMLSLGRQKLAMVRGKPAPALRGHKSNHGYFVFDPESARFTVKCHDPECASSVTLSVDQLDKFVTNLPSSNAQWKRRAAETRKQYWKCMGAETNDIFEFPPAPTMCNVVRHILRSPHQSGPPSAQQCGHPVGCTTQ